MKNYSTPRTLAESTFSVGYAEKPLPPARPTGGHPSTWVIAIIGLIGLVVIYFTS